MRRLNAELITAPALEFIGADRHVSWRAYQQDQVVCLSTPDMAFLLCTDGFWEHVAVSEMPLILAAADLSFAASVWVRQAARRAGAGGDNVAVALWRSPPRSRRGWLSFR